MLSCKWGSLILTTSRSYSHSSATEDWAMDSRWWEQMRTCGVLLWNPKVTVTNWLFSGLAKEPTGSLELPVNLSRAFRTI
ncbi:hypothetical protein T440DRAFT_541237 [Plenodomus tracheiphilus IPT5]|uniref:Uncharacterized protein n=1 Tax=Plenodomus tracheiphilus IPT5 TaxID=1408161 RepID=A0A6A7ATZ9_9PLEO|nr:hypothetical protein T440DRAFT_541237 [Plenodomus tracheiphilus IPT5]